MIKISVRVALTGLKKPPTVCGGGLVTEYVLDAIEFRWDAEHRIDDMRYKTYEEYVR